jgi:mycoredoxin-dependent peroxiredoxin
MNIQARIWLVITCLVLAIGVVYALSITPSTKTDTGDAAVVSATNEDTHASSATTGTTAVAEAPAVSLSPDLTKTDAFEFLDPAPLGKQAPDFSAKTADGKTIRLSDFKGKKNVVLVFYQGSFCSVCGAQLTNIQSHLSDFKAQDAEIIAISADDKLHAMQSVGEHGLTFNVVPDADKSIIQKFGIANVSKKGIAWPSLFVIDKKGLVQLNYASREGHRMHSNEILPVLSKITGKPVPKLTYGN